MTFNGLESWLGYLSLTMDQINAGREAFRASGPASFTET